MLTNGMYFVAQTVGNDINFFLQNNRWIFKKTSARYSTSKSSSASFDRLGEDLHRHRSTSSSNFSRFPLGICSSAKDG